MVHRDELRDARAPEAPLLLRQALRRADECRWATAAWDASDGVRLDAEAAGFRAQTAADEDAERLACRARDVRERGAQRLPLTRSELCTPDAAPSAA